MTVVGQRESDEAEVGPYGWDVGGSVVAGSGGLVRGLPVVAAVNVRDVPPKRSVVRVDRIAPAPTVERPRAERAQGRTGG